jgi:hypothetical protein
MGIMVSKEDDLNDELSRRISADLRAKMEASSKQENPDFMETEEYDDDLFKNIQL